MATDDDLEDVSYPAPPFEMDLEEQVEGLESEIAEVKDAVTSLSSFVTKAVWVWSAIAAYWLWNHW